MDCCETRTTFVEIELELARPEARQAFDEHLTDCDRCASWVADERRLTASLTALREELPFEIDVRERLASVIGQRQAGLRWGLPLRELAWSAAAAASIGAVLLVGLWQIAPGLPLLAVRARTLGSALVSATSTLAPPLKGFIATAAKFLGDLAASLGKLAASVESLQPLAILMVAVCTLMMAASIVLVVGRDIRRPHWIEEGPR